MSRGKFIIGKKQIKGEQYDKFHFQSRTQDKIISYNNFTYRIILKTIKKYTERKKIKTILDVGCGVGTVSLFLANQGYNVFGLDISRIAIKIAKQSAKKMGFNNTKFEVMNFPDDHPKKKYDLIIFSEVIEHLEDGHKAIKSLYKALNKGGILIITTPSDKAPLLRFTFAKKFDQNVGHLRRYSINELTTTLTSSGFKILEIKKTEGIIRNFLFIHPIGGKLLRFVKYFISDIVTLFDNISLKIFHESNFFIISEKI